MDRRLSQVLIVLAVLVSMVVFYGPTDNWAWDPSYYYAQLRSPIIENDLDFRNETATQGIPTRVTVTGLQGSPWPVGPSIVWSPFFLAAHLFVLAVNPVKATGLASPYIALVSFGSAVFGLAGLFILYRICRHFGGRFISVLAVLLSLGATPLFYYIFRQPIMAHSAGFLVAALLFLSYILLVKNDIDSKWSGLIFGVLCGLSFLMRWAGLLFLIFPLTFYGLRILRSRQAKNPAKTRFLLLQAGIAGLSFGLTILPQLAMWHRLYADFLVIPQGSSTFVGSILPVNLIKIFFDSNRGILWWSPFVLVGMLGILRIPNREVRYSTLLCLLSQVVLIGYRIDWYSGGGFGARYFVELLPLTAAGFVSLLGGFSVKTAGKAILAGVGVLLVVHQFVLMVAVEQAINGWVDFAAYLKGEPLGVRWQVESFLRLVKEPGILVAMRPYTGDERQPVLTNLLAGVRDYRKYVVPGAGVLLAPAAVLLGMWVRRLTNISWIPHILVGGIIYMVGWAVFLFLVG